MRHRLADKDTLVTAAGEVAGLLVGDLARRLVGLGIAGRDNEPDGAAILLDELANLLDDQHLDVLV